MADLELDDVVLVGFVSILSCFQLAMFAQKVGKLRQKHKVEAPSMTGPDEFLRGLRAQQNSVEFFAIFLCVMWMSAIFFHQVPAAVVGLLYLYARKEYFDRYLNDAKERIPSFKAGVKCLQVLLGMAAIGLTRSFLRGFFGINLL